MTFKGMLKFKLSLLALAAAGFSGYAQNVVTLADGKTAITWADFAKAINDPSQMVAATDSTTLSNKRGEYKAALTTAAEKLAAYNKAEADLAAWEKQLSTANANKTNANSDITSYKSQLSLLPKTDKLVDWFNTIYTAAKAYEYAYDNATAPQDVKMYYKMATGDRTGNVLTVAFVQPADFDPANTDATKWLAGNPDEFWTYIKNKKVGTLYVELGAEYAALATNTSKATSIKATLPGDVTGIVTNAVAALKDLSKEEGFSTQVYKNQQDADDLQELIDAAQTNLNAATTLIEQLTTKINGYTVAAEGSTSTQAQLKQASDDAAAAVTTTRDALIAEQTAYNKAVAENQAKGTANYKDITLSADVTADDIINSYDGVINANGHIINLGKADAVFKMFKGTLSNAGVNGKFAAAQSGAAYSSVTYWANNKGSYYNENGAKTENISTLGELGFVARESFGVDFDANKLVALTEASKVYGITVYTANSATKYFAKKAANGYVTSAGALTIAPNQFVKSETRDLVGANIFYSDNSCSEVVITDKADFFCPVDLQAAKVTYKRQFNAGKNAICLPFDLTKSMSDHIEFVCTYEKEDADHFWFTKRAGAITANTPALINAKEAFTEIILGNTTIKATPALQLSYDKGDLEDPSEACGLLKRANNEEIKGASNSNKVFGLTKEGTFKRVPDGTEFAALRMVVYSGETKPAQARAAAGYAPLDEKAIGILEENGTTAIEGVEAEAAKFTVAGGQGEINITSDADFSNVEIYSINGSLATVADVQAGATTTVSLPAGIYIVMGQKVQVK